MPALPATVVVRPIAMGDVPSYRACLHTVAREKRFLAMVSAPPLDAVEAFVREGLATDIAQFVAVDGEVVVGWADVIPEWPDAIAHRGRLGMGVLPAYRGRGIGEALLRACIDTARARGLLRIELEARADNTAAMGLYRKLGFEHEGLKRDAMRMDGVLHDTVQMALRLKG